MKTRRSIRNQDAMFKYLAPKIKEVYNEIEIVKRCSNCKYISSSRNYSNCKILKTKVYSQSVCDQHILKTK